MKAYYDNKPQNIEAVGNGRYYYRWGMEEVEAPSPMMGEEAEPRTQWKCQEVVFDPPMTVDNIATIVANELDLKQGSAEYDAMYHEVGLVVIPLDVEGAISILKGKILDYDSSEAVNSFTFGGIPMWLDKATRVGLKLRFEAEIKMGRETTTLWLGGMSFTLPLSGEGNAMDVLDAIELYASACYDITQMHLAEASKLVTAEDILDYDFTTGYPDKLVFG